MPPGAGDSFDAGAALALAAGASLAEATVVAPPRRIDYHPTTRYNGRGAPGRVAGSTKSLDSAAKGITTWINLHLLPDT